MYSNSQIKTWRKCQKLWEYKYIHKLAPRKISDALHYGSIVHRILDKLQSKDLEVIYDELWAEYSSKYFVEEIEEVFERSFSNIKDYIEHWSNEPLEVIDTEIYLKAEIEGVIIEGYADGLVKDHRGNHWLLENKTGKSNASLENRYWDLQVMLYHELFSYYDWIKDKYGVQLEGTVWNYITSTEITDPRILQNGTISKAQSQKTTWRRYKNTVEKQGLDLNDYLDMKPIFEARCNDFFQRNYLPYDVMIGGQMMKEFLSSVEDIEYKRKYKLIYPRTMEQHCSWCDYQLLCKAEFDTPLENLTDILEKHYEKRQGRPNNEINQNSG